MKGLFGHVNQNDSDSNEHEDNEHEDAQENAQEHVTDSDNENNTQDSQSPEANQVEHEGVKYSVGIDLGTTHCVMSYADLTKDEDEITQEVMSIPQLSSPGVVEDKKQLPSFLYLAHDEEIAEGETALPWTAKPEYLVGDIARTLGSKTPIRLVASAKSWLCHAGVDCKEAILPSEAPEEVGRVSPFQATKSYLQHMKDAEGRMGKPASRSAVRSTRCHYYCAGII
jgi:molecular chaperone DnaK (HSP70)